MAEKLRIVLATMPGMFKNRKANVALWAASVAVLALFWALLRYDARVEDRQFMRAMIPHHSAAIQMCKQYKRSANLSITHKPGPYFESKFDVSQPVRIPGQADHDSALMAIGVPG